MDQAGEEACQGLASRQGRRRETETKMRQMVATCSSAHLAPRSGEREGPGAQRREGEGHARYLLLSGTHANSRKCEMESEAIKGPLTVPLLRNGSLPLPALRGEVIRVITAQHEDRS